MYRTPFNNLHVIKYFKLYDKIKKNSHPNVKKETELKIEN